MSTQIVQHKSRDFDVVLNFHATENTLSWAFTAENDGEIYAIDLVNVASYQIAGAPVTLPYAVTAGSSYSVTIVKQTNGQPASISFNTRRAVSKTVTISVPDFGAYVGDYFYALKNNNELVKLNKSAFSASNYAGVGVWSVSPLNSSVILPTLTSGVWQGCHFGNGKIVCIASESEGDNKYNFCLVDYHTLAVTDLEGTANTYTTIIVGGAGNGVYSCAYNYIRDQLIFGTSNGVFILDVPAKILTLRPAGSAAFTLIDNASPKKRPSFNPFTETYSLSGDILESELQGYATNYKLTTLRGVAFNPTTGYTHLCDNGNRLQGFDINGRLMEVRLVSHRSFENAKWIKDDIIVAFKSATTRYLIFSQLSGYSEIDYASIDGFETNMFFDDIAIGGNVVMFKNNLQSNRLFIFDSDTKSYTGYFDLTGGTNINMICASQHI